MSNTVKKVVTSLLLICFLTTDISPAFAQNNQGNIAIDPAQLSDLEADKYLLNPDQLSPEDQALAKKFLQLPTQYNLEILFLLKNLYFTVKMFEEKLGTEAVTKILEKRQNSESINYQYKNLGKAEPLVINTSRGPLYFTKVRHNALKMTILFIDKSQIDIQFLEESEKRVKLGMTYLDPTLKGLSEKDIKLELAHRKLILNHMRKIYAKMLMNQWEAKWEYVPLSEQTEIDAREKTIPSPEEMESKVNAVLNEPIETLKEKPWFRELTSKVYNTMTDLAQQEKDISSKTAGNEAMMVMMYDSSAKESGITQNTIEKGSRFSLGYWKKWWGDIYEKPTYGEPVWKNNKGIGKLKVLFTGDYLVGLGFGVALGLLSTGTAFLVPTSLPEGLAPLDVGVISFGYSLFFGVFGKTWSNFAYKGTELLRFIKNWVPGIAQSYTFNTLSSESLNLLRTDGTFDTNAAKIHADIVVNQSIKTVTKTSLQEIPRTRQKTGEAQGTLKIPYYKVVAPWKHDMNIIDLEVTETTVDTLKYVRWLRNQFTIEERERKSWEDKFLIRFHRDWKIRVPWLIRKEYETYIRKQNFENQSPQFLTTPVGLLSRFGFSIKIPGTPIVLPVGHLLYILLGPIGEVRQIRYKRDYVAHLTQTAPDHPYTNDWTKYLHEEIDKWNSLKIFNIQNTQFIGYVFVDIPKQAYLLSKEIANWAARKIAYFTYETIQTTKNKLDEIKAQEQRQRDAIDGNKLLMTVQTEGGKPHPVQIIQATKKYQRAQQPMCARLFQ